MKHNQLARRALWLLQRAHRRRSVRKLKAARRAFENVLELMSPHHPDRPACLSNLSTALRLQYEWMSDTTALDRLVEVNELITQDLSEDHPQRNIHRHNLRNIVAELVTGPRRPGLLARAVPLAREAAADPAHRAVFLEALIACLDELFEHTEDAVVMLELIALDRERLASVPDDDPEAGALLGDLGASLRTLALLRGQPEDLAEAVAVGRQAVERCPSDHEHRATCLTLLCNSLHALFVHQDRSMETLLESVAVGRQAVAAAPAGHPHRSSSLNGLGIALRTLFEETRDLDALHEAVRVCREAVAKVGPDDARRARYLGNLSAVDQELFKRTGDRQAILEAVAASREAVELSPGDTPQRANRLSDLGNALHILSGDLYVASPDDGSAPTEAPGAADGAPRIGGVPALREAVRVARAAVAAGPRDDADRGGRLSNLSVAARTLFELTGDTAVLEEAVQAARNGVAAATADTTTRATALVALVRALARCPAEPDVLREMHGLCAELATAATTPRSRVIAHLHLGRAAMSADPPEAGTALAAYEKAIAWLPEIAPRHLLRPDREYGLGELAGLPAEAASAALHLGRPEHALLLLEHARGLLLREGMGGRDDLGELRRADPEAAEEFVRLRDLLNASDQAGADLFHGNRGNPGNPRKPRDSGSVPAAARHSGRAQRHRELAERWESLLDRVRALPGLGGFLLPPTIESLRRRPAGGPVVLVNASPFRCDALILTSGSPVRALRLDCDYLELRERARDFQRLPLAAPHTSTDPSRPDEARLLVHLAWLWDRIGRPVLAELGLLSPSPVPAGEAPRIWWCPIGVAAFLPLHAAGRHIDAAPDSASTVMDHVVSSYTSTVHALPPDDARRATGAGTPGRDTLLIVEVSEAPGAPSLPGARFEADRLAELVPDSTVLSGARATRDAVLGALPGHGVAHFACHAVTDPRSPSLNRLLLHDHTSAPLTAIELSALNVPHGTLAYLSACETAKSNERLADEAVHIATAFQLAGYRHVVGTLWPVGDSAAGRVADDFYTGLAPSSGSGSFDSDHAARILHRAVHALREDVPDEPSRWAAHIHLGP
ncbi:CHAT domain-containing protein [Streptomyces phyllanthi]|uniref:CHAT domain-containing protein n=1 Tax=Streptomyces phyllanthi TaxID=1803180 RepID=A0A5N8VTV0_9ACTN|nr:CHAT domain-containing protein [Streptomyces phyllanthi]MPY38667.1 CHAT domain-containing protein [Streptomyces phyllanthi]